MNTLRVIKRPDPLPYEVRELDEQESAFHLGRDFGMPEFKDTEADALDWALEEIKPSRASRTHRRWK